MKSPYEILNIKPDADKKEIHDAFYEAVKTNSITKKYTMQELAEAYKSLTVPAKRLIADFLFPLTKKSKRLKLIELEELGDASISTIKEVNKESFDSLYIVIKYE